jgi:hypothetical protein
MKTFKTLTLASIAALAVTLLFQTPTTRAEDQGQRSGHQQKGTREHGDVRVSFTKWVTSWPNMAGVVGGDVGSGAFAGEVLLYTEGPTTRIEALYHFKGPDHSFSALVHVEQTGLKAVIIGVVTDGWLKGHSLEGEYTQIDCEHDGVSSPCYQGTLTITRNSKD